MPLFVNTPKTEQEIRKERDATFNRMRTSAESQADQVEALITQGGSIAGAVEADLRGIRKQAEERRIAQERRAQLAGAPENEAVEAERQRIIADLHEQIAELQHIREEQLAAIQAGNGAEWWNQPDATRDETGQQAYIRKRSDLITSLQAAIDDDLIWTADDSSQQVRNALIERLRKLNGEDADLIDEMTGDFDAEELEAMMAEVNDTADTIGQLPYPRGSIDSPDDVEVEDDAISVDMAAKHRLPTEDARDRLGKYKENVLRTLAQIKTQQFWSLPEAIKPSGRSVMQEVQAVEASVNRSLTLDDGTFENIGAVEAALQRLQARMSAYLAVNVQLSETETNETLKVKEVDSRIMTARRKVFSLLAAVGLTAVSYGVYKMTTGPEKPDPAPGVGAKEDGSGRTPTPAPDPDPDPAPAPAPTPSPNPIGSVTDPVTPSPAIASTLEAQVASEFSVTKDSNRVTFTFPAAYSKLNQTVAVYILNTKTGKYDRIRELDGDNSFTFDESVHGDSPKFQVTVIENGVVHNLSTVFEAK